MTQNLPDAPVPRRKQILPEGVVRAKDNVDDFSFSQKRQQSEAEHNMGYFLAELNNRNEELENLLEHKDSELNRLRRYIADSEKECDDLRNINTGLRDTMNDWRGKYSDVAQQRNEARQELRTLRTQHEMLREQNGTQWDVIHCLERRVGTYKIVAGIAVVVAILTAF